MFHSLRRQSQHHTRYKNFLQFFLQILEWQPEPDTIVAIRCATEGSDTEVLVQWKHLPEFEATWEPISTLKKQFPLLHLEDKVACLGGGIDRLACEEEGENIRKIAHEV